MDAAHTGGMKKERQQMKRRQERWGGGGGGGVLKKQKKKQQQRASPQATLCPPHVWKYLNVFLLRILSYGRMFRVPLYWIYAACPLK